MVIRAIALSLALLIGIGAIIPLATDLAEAGPKKTKSILNAGGASTGQIFAKSERFRLVDGHCVFVNCDLLRYAVRRR